MLKFLTLKTVFLFFCLSISNETLSTTTPTIKIPATHDWKSVIKLDGHWDFYWKQFINPKNIASKKTTIYQLPSNWTSKSINGEKFNNFGYASYATEVHLTGKFPKKLYLKINRIKTAHTIYVNGEQLSIAGSLSKTKENFAADYKPYITQAINIPDDGILKIIIHVANFEFYRGGIYKSIEIGTYDALNTKKNLKIFLSSLVFGAILIMGIYHLLLWLRKHDNLASLSFGLFCLIMAYREIFIAERIIYIIFPDIANATVVKSDLFTVYAGLPLMHLFIHFLFPKQSPVKWVHISGLIAIGLTAVLLFGSLYASEAAILPFEIYVLLLLLLCFYIGIKAVIEKEDGAVIFLIGYLGVFAAAVNDILYERGVIDTAFIFYIGTLFFVFSQASIISKRFASAYVELELLKNSLENTVNIRTRELRIARDEALNISEQNKRLSTSMTSAIENERKTIATEIHDNFNSIMVATRMQAVSILNMINDGANHQAEIARIAGNIRDNMKTSYTEARALVSRLRPESIDALPLDAALRELLNTYKTDQMHIAFNASGDSQLFNHEELKINLYRICQEALTNILKHAQANTITVNLAMNKDCHLTINDNGRGFNTDTVPGNGLTHIKQRTLGLGGTFTITSGETGTTISITVPSAC